MGKHVWELTNLTAILEKNEASYLAEGFREWNIKEHSTESFWMFYVPSFVLFLLGWFYYMVMEMQGGKKTGSKSMRLTLEGAVTNMNVMNFLDLWSALGSKSSAGIGLGSWTEKQQPSLKSTVNISKDTVILMLSLSWVCMGMTIEILAGVPGVSMYGIIAATTAGFLYRFFSASGRRFHVMKMVPNLLLIIAVVLTGAAYTDTFGSRMANGKNYLYFAALVFGSIAAIFELISCLYTHIILSSEEQLYEIPTIDYVGGVLVVGLFLSLELGHAAMADRKHYAYPFVLLWIWTLLIVIRVFYLQIVQPFMDSKTSPPVVWLARVFNVVLSTFPFLTVVFGHMSVCDVFPGIVDDKFNYDENSRPAMCAGLYHINGRLTLFATFGQIFIFFMWLGYIRTSHLRNMELSEQMVVSGKAMAEAEQQA